MLVPGALKIQTSIEAELSSHYCNAAHWNDNFFLTRMEIPYAYCHQVRFVNETLSLKVPNRQSKPI